MSARLNARTLKAQIDEVIDADWSHSAWWLLAWLTGLFEQYGSPHRTGDQVRYHGANGGPHSDTFMAHPRAKASAFPNHEHRPEQALFEWGARSALGGLAALRSLGTELPGQPLHVVLKWSGRWLEVAPLPAEAHRNVVFTYRDSHFLAGPVPTGQRDLTQGLQTLSTGAERPSWLRSLPSNEAVAASLVVSLDVHHHDQARHTHRTPWNTRGGPWLGIARTPTLDLVTTCHLVVDGLGHALLTDRILAGPAGCAGNAITESAPAPRASQCLSTGLAWAFLSEGAGRFAEQAYATGVALEGYYGAGGHASGRRRYSPPFTVPVAPGASNDPARRFGRVLHGLLSVRRAEAPTPNGAPFESFADFQGRIGAWLETERAGGGILARISSAVSRGPLPRPLKHLALSNHHGPRRSIPSVEGLSGRARLSSIRFPGESVAAPLIAASLPTLLPNNDDDRGGVVLTLIHHDKGTTVTVFGTGKAAKGGGARTFLERWLDALADVRKG